MLIDCNAHIGEWPFRQRKYNICEGLISRMDDFGVESGFISNLSSVLYKNTQTGNESLVEAIQSKRKFRNRLFPVGVINPIYGGGWRNDFKICTEKFGMKAIKLYPVYHGYDFNHENCIELVKMARDKGVVVCIPFRVVDPRPSSWMDVEKELGFKDVMTLVRHVPDAKYLFLNIASGINMNSAELALFKKADTMIDTSGRAINTLPQIIQKIGIDKIALGTHSPTLDYCTGQLRIEALYDSEANEKDKELMRSGNIKRMFNL